MVPFVLGAIAGAAVYAVSAVMQSSRQEAENARVKAFQNAAANTGTPLAQAQPQQVQSGGGGGGGGVTTGTVDPASQDVPAANSTGLAGSVVDLANSALSNSGPPASSSPFAGAQASGSAQTSDPAASGSTMVAPGDPAFSGASANASAPVQDPAQDQSTLQSVNTAIENLGSMLNPFN